MNRDILMAPLHSPSASIPLLVSTFDEKGFALPPDGDYASTPF